MKISSCKKITLALLSFLFSSAALAFETGNYECFNGPMGEAGSKVVSNFRISKVNLKTEAGDIMLPYMEYTYNDGLGARGSIKGMAQVSSETWTNSMDKEVIQMDSQNIRIVFAGGKVQTMSGECRKAH